MDSTALLEDVKNEFHANRRRFAAGLLIAFIRFLRELNAIGEYDSFDSFSEDFAVQERSRRGGRANTLIVKTLRDDGSIGTLSIRPAYNEVETLFRATHKRFDYPNAAPHATQAWSDYTRWLDALLQMSPEDASVLEKNVIEFVLAELPSHEIDQSQLKPIRRRFFRLLQEFEMTAQRGEPRGAAYQGAVYAFIRADAPHLQLDVAKVGAGSRRLQRVGDVDGWQGEQLILSAEVKHLHLTVENFDDLADFMNQITQRGALGLIVAESFDDEARYAFEDNGLRTLDREDLIRLVDIWDPLKQDAAVNAFLYYVCHIEKRMPLISRVRDYFQSIDNDPRN